MSRSRGRKGAGKDGPGGWGGRAQTVGIFLTLLAVAVLVGSLVAGVLGPEGEAAALPPDSGDPGHGITAEQRVRVEVLNASGVPGLAAEGRRVLRERGFDVVYIGNAGAEFGPDSSLVLDRVGWMDAARAVADAAGVRRVFERPDANRFVDATVVLGRDWRVGDPGDGP